MSEKQATAEKARATPFQSKAAGVLVPFGLALASVVLVFLEPSSYKLTRIAMPLAGLAGIVAVAGDTENTAWIWVFATIVLLWNPLFPVYLGNRELWLLLDVAAVIGMFIFASNARLERK